mmetsp:Transcript_32018/g.56214  ORF Transcript_32018/g.56214 Transcript_32018/m.56214 type:complete len:272 (-) Transcript_32018:228-1043(-)|eukprot:CAMPEP_0197527688 /NCGR_PEP_ID=MMETSP1318-20131121/22578_1 /TAXON_ID=552666 /ORGANISM="Partenskyella glossopodia, Strain RCC365" /LENGTH=271 /DNA_ID=CAMNT_0043082465 /DNA_START=42 /DNA_END=857 /DNA_ORIENTATION=-
MTGEKFNAGDAVFALHGPKLYKAKILKTKNTKDGEVYFVHYQGWKKKWDEWVNADRLKAQTKENEKLKEDLDSNFENKNPKDDKSKKHPQEEVLHPGNTSSLKINLSGELKKRLIDDWEQINRHKAILNLPASPNVETILDFYLTKSSESKDEDQQALSKNVVEALKIYFRHSLSKLLLYRFERPQYEKEAKDKDPLQYYGAHHLLRLFVKIPSLVANTGLNDEQITAIRKEISQLCSYMTKQKEHVFATADGSDPYKKQPKEYLNMLENH